MNNNYNKYFTETENGLDIEANNINANCITSRNNKFSLDSDGNLTVNSITAVVNNLNIDTIYPVGSIYMNINDVNPDTLFKGTKWEKIQGRFLLGSSTKFKIGQTGGAETVTLTTSQIPAHTHGSKTLVGRIRGRAMTNGGNIIDADGNYGITSTDFDGGAEWSWGVQGVNNVDQPTDVVNIDATHEHASVGENKSHNNMPPYLVVNIWKRIS